MSLTPEVLCGVTESYCVCVLPAGHPEKLHVCHPECGGSWGYDDEGRFVIGTFPSGIPIQPRLRVEP